MNESKSLTADKIQEANQIHREWLSGRINAYVKENGFNHTCREFDINTATLSKVLNNDKTIKFDTLWKYFKKLY